MASARILSRARAAVQERRQRDPGEDGEPAEPLRDADRVAERDDAAERAHERLEVDERARPRRRHLRLAPGEQPEAGERAADREREHSGDGSRRGRRRRGALGQQRHGQGEQRRRAELDRRHRARVAPGEQLRLHDHERRRAGHRGEHEQVARERRARAAAAGDERHTGDRDQRAGPAGGTAAGAPEGRRDHGDEHRRGADHQRGMADARALDPGVLQQDHAAVAERACRRHGWRQRRAQVAAREQRDQRRGEREPGNGEPARAEPLEAELGQRHGQPPQRSRGGERDDRPCAAREGHDRSVGRRARNTSLI
jgi:hypothetical protein